MNQILLASPQDIEAVGKLYDAVNEYFEQHENYCFPNWQKGKYPVAKDAQRALEEGTLYVLKTGKRISGAAIISYSQHPAYQKIPWTRQAMDQDVMTLHTVVVDPACRGKGLGEQLVRFGIELCRKAGAKTIRLDTHYKNVPARRLYEKCGFTSLGCHQAVSDGILQQFDVFEYLL